MASNEPSSAMPKKRVQFQKGLSLARFLQDYGSEPQCRIIPVAQEIRSRLSSPTPAD